MKHIEPSWEQFAAKIIPGDANEHQRKMMRQSFYAGAVILFSMLTKKIDDPATTSQDGAKFMGEISEEINQFANQVQAGKA